MPRVKRILFRPDMLPRFLQEPFRKIQDSPLGSRLASGVLWSISGGAASRLFALFVAIIVARIIGKREFGELGIIQSTVGVFGLVAAFGMDTTTMKYVAEFRTKDPSKTGRIIKLAEVVSASVGLFICLTFIIVSPWVAASVLAAPHLTPLLRAGSILLFCGAVNSSQTGSLAGFEAFKDIMVINVITAIFSFCASLLGVFLLGLQGVVYAMIGTMIVTLAINQFALKKVARRSNVRLSYAHCLQERGIITGFSVPAMLSGIIVMSATWLCSALLVNTPHGYEEMGVYNAASVWKAPILFFPSAFATIFLSILSNLLGEKRQGSYNKVLRTYLILNTGIAVVVACIIAAFSNTIMSVYGNGFSSGGGVLMIFAFASIPLAMGNVLDNAISSHGKAWGSFVINFFWAALCIGLTWFLLDMGARGLVLALLGSYIVLVIARGVYLYGSLMRKVEKAIP
ncbi:MAG: oligosaccharide flippase family protein [Bacteroidota bacterium]